MSLDPSSTAFEAPGARGRGGRRPRGRPVPARPRQRQETGACGPPGWVAALAVLALSAVATGPLAAGQPAPSTASATPGGQAGSDGAEWFPSRSSFAPLLAAPREVALRGAFLAADREELPGDFRGTNLEADVALGHRLPVVRIQRAREGRPEVTLGFEAGVFTRFFMETPQKDLIAADFRVGAPLSARWGEWTGRLTLLHVSGHLGDDFVDRFGSPARQRTRDGLELLLARRLGGAVRLYGGAEWNFHVNEGVERAAARAGVEWDPDPGAGAGRSSPSAGGAVHPDDPDDTGGSSDGSGVEAWPFAAGDARVTSLTEEVTGSAAGGLAVRVEGVVLRVEARAHVGPTALGELRTRDETAVGLGLRVEP